MQCLATTAALWHKYDPRTIKGVQLTLYYPAHESASMYIPGLGALRMMLHWASWGKEYELVKALDIQLPDHRRYTLHNENFQSLNQLGIRLSRMEQELRCDAMRTDAPVSAKVAAALLYFRYCYDHNEFMELSSIAQLAPTVPGDDDAPTQFLRWLCPIFISLEQRLQG